MTAEVALGAYATAEELLRHNRADLVRAASITPDWQDDGRFTYVVDGQTWLVDPAAGTREPVAERIQDPGRGLDVPSPDGKWAVIRKGHDLWVRPLPEGESRPLTTDGEAGHEYGDRGLTPWSLLRKLGVPALPPAVAWSPDSTRVLTNRGDLRGVGERGLVDHAPAGGGAPETRLVPIAYPGDQTVPTTRLYVLHVATGEAVPMRGEPSQMPVFAPVHWNWAWWSPDGAWVYFLCQSRDQRSLSLRRMDPATGEVVDVVTETGPTRVEPGQLPAAKPLVRVLRDGRVLWYSQRDGWGHLYLYSPAGEPLGQLTSGEWPVQDILHVDEDAEVVYFLAAGLVEEDPYRRAVCRVSLSGNGFARITEDCLDHAVTVPPHARYFLDSASTVAQPPVLTVRSWSGEVLVELERTDVSALLATGWTPPERFRVKAADGETDLYGVLHRPHGLDPARRYPVIDNIYPGPQVMRVLPSFDQGFLAKEVESLAALGFAVVALDGRGTPGRSKAFHDASYGRLCDAGNLADHVAAIQELARTRPWLDTSRVGIYGHSGGGYATTRALLTHPDFFRVGVALAGPQDLRLYMHGWGEGYDGPYEEEVYRNSSNVELADRLRGKLLLVHGGVDDNVLPHHTLRLVERLVEADRDVDLLLVPGGEHALLGYDHHVTRRLWDYFVRHLQGATPPPYRLRKVPLSLEVLRAMAS
ncbi:dipeptidyl aminopeptidase/acylaminoacyl peptidase [Crossiella equi]|uniref:Dipeptidyl aminopeptidase/acylaminoacyl peptidase n=1 Tax=Crossiella equi TaxID=130796 RepID=A0ABS5AEC1_9PSEU|nr:DPP IV N-terminal domain-containing protein [Crossiella equi]MBP2474929.1 dipeptidyl aminopeptidase/acylaminoacyl peptidase [Crossiella equi]